MNLTSQEQKIVAYLSDKSRTAWEELVQFAKNPQSVKLKTLQKAVSDIKRKYKKFNEPLPFNCQFYYLTKEQPTFVPAPQQLVQLRTTKGGRKVPSTNTDLDAHIDFQLDKYYRRVKTRLNTINLSDAEYELFSFLHASAGKKVSLEDMKNVVYAGYGSKTPYNWADAIKRTLGKLRTNIRELKTENRLITMMGGNTTYYMLE